MPTIEQMLFQGQSNLERLKWNTIFLILNTSYFWCYLSLFFSFILCVCAWFFVFCFVFGFLPSHITLLTCFIHSELHVAIPSHVYISPSFLILSFSNIHILYSAFPYYIFPLSAEEIKSIMVKQDSKTTVYWLRVLTLWAPG